MATDTPAIPIPIKPMNGYVPEVCLALSLAGLGPLLYYQMLGLWERPHFQFFPLAWAVFLALIIQRGQREWSLNPWRQRLGILTWAFGLVNGAVGGFFFSPWLAQSAAIFCITGWGLLRLADTPWLRWLAWTLLLWITLPLPGQMDTGFINELQRLSSHSASALLDLLGIPHLRQGTLIEIRSHRLFVDEACSGVDSLYSLLAITLVMMLWMQRPLIVGLFALLSVPLWAWLGNVIRLLVIVFLLDQYDVDLSHGWRHTLLGLCTFIISSLCLLATLDSLTNLLKRFSLNVIPRDNGTWYRWYNNLVCFPGKSPVVSGSVGASTVAPPTRTKSSQTVMAARGTPRLGSLIVVIMGSMAILGLTGRSMTLDGNTKGVVLPHYEVHQVDQAFNEQGLPEQLGTAKRLTYRSEDRDPDNFLGEHSRMWLYRDNNSDVQFSMDFPFRGFHALWVCYTNAGHQVEGSPVAIASPVTKTADGAPAIQRVTLRDELGSYAYLWFVLFDSGGVSVSVKDHEYIRNRFLYGLNTALGGVLAPEPVTYQFQMLVTSGRQLTELELSDYSSSFQAALPHAQIQVDKLVKQTSP